SKIFCLLSHDHTPQVYFICIFMTRADATSNLIQDFVASERKNTIETECKVANIGLSRETRRAPELWIFPVFRDQQYDNMRVILCLIEHREPSQLSMIALRNGLAYPEPGRSLFVRDVFSYTRISTQIW
ncbi:MAG TPA: hypothetical protein VHD63_23445, partial [Ktedonobacteraceae bacterium]|nr:hypothetical protein [Ktedonobacteraceae bacterium]